MQLLWSLFSTRKMSTKAVLRSQYMRSMYYVLRCHRWGWWTVAIALLATLFGLYDQLLSVLLLGALAATPFPWVLYCSACVWESLQSP